MLTGGVVKEALLPAASVTTTCLLRPVPSPAISSGLLVLVEAIPEVASVVSKVNVTSLLCQPEALAAGEGGPNTS